MANPTTYGEYAADIGRVTTNVQWTSGAASAAPTTFKRGAHLRAMSQSPAGIVKAATGTVTLNLKEAWLAVLDYDVEILQATYNAGTGACYARLSVDSVATSVPLVTFIFMNAAGATVDLAAGDIVRVRMALQQRSV